MAQRVVARQVTVTAGTLIASPHVVDITFDAGEVEAIEIVIPDGHAGFTGIALQQAHSQVIPEDSGTWLISNDEKVNFPVRDYLNNGNWQAVMYNTDVYDHSFYVRFLVNDLVNNAAQVAFGLGVGAAVGSLPAPPDGDSGVGVPGPVTA